MSVSKSSEDIITIFSVFTEEVEEIGVSEMSRNLGFYPSKVHRICSSLVKGGFLELNPKTKKYRLGLRTFEIGMFYLNHLPLRKLVRPHAEMLATKFEANVHLAVLNKTYAIIIDRVQNLQSSSLIQRISLNVPLHSSAAGKVLLAYLHKDQQKEIIQYTGLNDYTEHTITSSKELEEELNMIVKQGYALDLEETNPNIHCIAIPIRDSDSKVIASLSISDASERLTKNRFQEIISELKRTSLFISRQLGY